MEEVKKISLKCQKCGREFQCKTPSASGNYSVTCSNPDCNAKVTFKYASEAQQQPSTQNPEIKFGLLDDGSYRFRCGNDGCHKSILVPPKMIKMGHNKAICPNCKTLYEFDVEPTETDLLKCQRSECDGTLERPNRGDGIYTAICKKCNQEYSLIMQNGKVIKAAMKTSISAVPKRQAPMKLVSGTFLSKKEYNLSKGTHYVGRYDELNVSDFPVKDKYASSRSIRIDVNENGGRLVYKMTIERAINPVYHNNRELTVGDVVFLTYGDTIKLGKTLVKVQKKKQ